MAPRKPKNKGYVNAEDVLGVLNPKYDEYNIAHETALLYPELRQQKAVERLLSGPFRFREMASYEDASRRMIESALERLR